LSSFEQLCNLQEKNGLKLLPAKVPCVGYHNDCAASLFSSTHCSNFALTFG
jgi:hypothetical protein